MSDFAYVPVHPIRVDDEPRVLAAQFGDGYEQRVADGINNNLPKWNLTFIGETDTIAAARAQLNGYGGVTAFTWTPQGESEVTVVCRRWSRASEVNAGTLTAVFEEVPA